MENKEMLMRERNEQQERFIEEFVVHGNATKAALKAGYSEKSANTRGYQLKVRYQDEIDKRSREAIKSLVPGAIAQLKTLAVEGQSEQVRLAATKDILDRAGFKPTEKIEQQVTQVEQTTQELREELAQLMGESESEPVGTLQ